MVSHPDSRMNVLLLPGVLILSLKGGQMDPLSGGASIRALILFQMVLCCKWSTFISHLLWLLRVFIARAAAHTVLQYIPL